MSRLVALAVALSACSASPTPQARFEPDGDSLLTAPWPHDMRRDADGTVTIAGFPNPDANPLLQAYLDLADGYEGFGNNSPIFLPLQGAPDLDLLPTPEASVEDGSPLLLIDVDPASAFQGERIPVTWDFQADETHYQPANLLAVAPLFGFPLRPNTTYALIATTDLIASNPDFDEVWRSDHPLHAHYATLEDALFFQGLSRRDVGIATVFTTSDPLAEMTTIARFLTERVTPASLDQTVAPLASRDTFELHGGHYASPVFQEGQRPYVTSGGGFAFDEEGTPIVNHWDDMRLAISVPNTPMPAAGWPVVVYQHGTGGDYRSFEGTSALDPAAMFAEAGFVGLGIDQPLHGTRGGGALAESLSFNYLNPAAGRANFRQGAIDALYLVQALHDGAELTTESGDRVRLDPDQIHFMGHSQGGLTGAIALPFLGGFAKAAVLSGAGGNLSITLVERKDPLDIAELLAETLDFDADEVVSPYHPALALVQWLVEVTDPVNYAPYWYSESLGYAQQAPMDVLVFSGMDDEFTPFRTAEALAAAGRVPMLAPGVTHPDSQTLRGFTPQEGPLQDNVGAFEGTVTAALSQWEERDHFVIFRDRAAATQYRRFLQSSAEGHPTIEAP